MNLLQRRSRAVALAASLAVAAAVPAATPASASCLLPLQLPPVHSADTVVLVGSIVGIDGARTDVEVQEWFMGSDPTGTVEIVGARDAEVITSADWTPTIGDEYAIVAVTAPDGTLTTELCQQQLASPELLATLHEAYGGMQSPPSLSVDLANATGSSATIEIRDASGTVLDASSGIPGDGVSVAPGELIVENEAATTLRLTWSAGPCDSESSLAIDETGRRFLLTQPDCTGDSIAYDRVLILGLAEPVAAAEVEAIVRFGPETPG